MKNLLKEAQVAKIINMTTAFLRRDRVLFKRGEERQGPPWLKIGRTVRYEPEAIEKWLMNRRIA